MERDIASLYRELMDDPLRVAGPGELESDELATDACDHRWNFVRDWYGYPNVINGTPDCSSWRCRKCGEEQTEQPEDWSDYPDPDEFWQRMEQFCEAKTRLHRDASKETANVPRS